MRPKNLLLIAFVIVSVFLFPISSSAHCDGLDGPVVIAAKEALRTGNVNLVLIWVLPKDQEIIKHTFDHTVKVRKLNEEARKLADTYFFDTLVRIHRAGEGVAYTGLKPAGRDLGPAIPAADKAIETESAKDLVKLINDEIHSGLHKRFMKAMEMKNYDQNDIIAGQEYVAAYVNFLHYAEGIYNATQIGGHAHDGNAKVDLIDHHNH